MCVFDTVIICNNLSVCHFSVFNVAYAAVDVIQTLCCSCCCTCGARTVTRGYGVDDHDIRVRLPTGSNTFSTAQFLTESGAQPASFPQGTCSKATGGYGVVTNVWSYADTPLYVFVTGRALPI